MASTVPRGAVRLEAEAAMGLDSVVTLARGLGTGGTAERRLRPSPGPRLCPEWRSCGPKGQVQGWVPPKPRGAPWTAGVSTNAIWAPGGLAIKWRAGGG